MPDESSVKLTNFYEHVKKKHRQEPIEYDNFKKIHIKLPSRMLIIGATGSGKTNAAINIMEQIHAFNRVLLFAKNLTEPLYADLIDKMREAEKDTNESILTVSSKIEDLPPLSSINRKNNTLLIVDDMVTEKHKALAGVVQYWTAGRKENVTSMYLSQSYYAVPKIMRQNSEYIVLTKIRTTRDLNMILSEYRLGVSEKEMSRLYHEATKNGFPDFFLIDLEAGIGDANKDLRFRRNFTSLKANYEGAESKTGEQPASAGSKTGKKGKLFRAPNPQPQGKAPPPAEPPPLEENPSQKQVSEYVKFIHEEMKARPMEVESLLHHIEHEKNLPGNIREELIDEVMHIPEEEPVSMDMSAGKLARKRKTGGSVSRPNKRISRVKRNPPAAYRRLHPAQKKASDEIVRFLERQCGIRAHPYWHA
jgi:hypothetical protein